MIVGKKMDSISSIDKYITKLENLRKNSKLIDTRIKFLIEDIMDLRNNNWVANRNIFVINASTLASLRNAQRNPSQRQVYRRACHSSIMSMENGE